MNTEPVPTVDAEIVEPAPLDEKSAKVLDTKIRLVATNIKTNWEKLKDYIAEAKAGQIHSALGKPTWTAYLAEVLEIGWQDRDERRKIVALLSDAGMSQRAIAEAVGTSQKTVDRDLDEPSHDDSVDQTPESDTESAKVVSLDGKRRPKHPKPKAEVPKPKSQPKAGSGIWGGTGAGKVEQTLRECAAWMNKATRKKPLPLDALEFLAEAMATLAIHGLAGDDAIKLADRMINEGNRIKTTLERRKQQG
jgi:hypothetical protein